MATSPKAVRRLVYGELDKIIDTDRHFLDDDPETYYIDLFKDFRNAEGKAMANLAADKIAQREFDRFRNALIVASANQDLSLKMAGPTAHIKLNLPFSHPATLTIRGKFMRYPADAADKNSKEARGFLAAEILKLDVKLVFNRLLIDRKNKADRGANSGDLDLPAMAFSTIRAPFDRAESMQPLSSGDDPDSSLEKLCLDAAGDFIAEGLVIVESVKEVQKYRNAAKLTPSPVIPRKVLNESNPI